MSINADESELNKFNQRAHEWWDSQGAFKTLHDINPLRLAFIEYVAQGVKQKSIVDVGCGGGILAESLARQGAQVLGIDLAEKSLKIARLHSLESGASINYRCTSVEDLAQEAAGNFDMVTCMEMLEHVPSPENIVTHCAQLIKPGGWAIFSTLNRSIKCYLLAIIGAEYLFNMLPRGTHDYARFLRPSELGRMIRNAGLNIVAIKGIKYHPLSQRYALSDDADVNYLVAAQRPASMPIEPNALVEK